MATVKKEEKKPIKTGASSGHITNLQQSILETFDIYDSHSPMKLLFIILPDIKEPMFIERQVAYC
jgi:hypothetical protein